MSKMINIFSRYTELESTTLFSGLQEFVAGHPQGNFFQTPGFFQLVDGMQEMKPVQLVMLRENGTIAASLLGVVQSNGKGLKSWMSRRLIVWGGPLLGLQMEASPQEAMGRMLQKLKSHASGRAIFIEFRNFFDMSDYRDVFEFEGFDFEPYLNYLLPTDDEAALQSRLSRSRKRQIKSSQAMGGEVVEAGSEEEVTAFYRLLQQLYAEKVKKPLIGPELFLRFFRSGAGKFYVVKYKGEAVGGNMCPVFGSRTVYEWYRCGDDNLEKGLHPNVLATWAPIEYAVKNGFECFDFMGAGRADEEYGVRDFKARFGGEEVCFGRYRLVVNKPLYHLGKLGLEAYRRIKKGGTA